MSDRIGVMFQGRLVQVAAPPDLYSSPCNREVASFIGEMNFLPGTVSSETESAITVDSPGFGQMTIPRNPNVETPGKSVLLGIRPEQLEIAKDKPEDYDATIEGVVRDVAFYGENVHYHVRVDGIEDRIAISVPNYFHTVDHRPGDKVWLGVQGESVIDLGQQADKTN